MKFIPKKPRSFYILLLVSLLFPVVAPDRLTPKASAIELLSVSWGLGAITWAGPAVTAALVSFFLADKVSTNNNNASATNSQRTECCLETPDKVGVRSVPSQQVDASFQNNYPLSSNDAIACMKGLLISGKSVANMYNHFTTNMASADNTHSQSEYVSQHNKMNKKGFLERAYEHVRDIKNHYKRILAGEDLITTEDFSKRGCRNWTVGNYKRHLIYKYRLRSVAAEQGYNLCSGADFDRVLPEKIRRSLFCDLALYKRPGYVKFLATLTCPHNLQRALIFEERLYKHAHVIELYKTFDGFEEYLPILLDQASIKKNTNLGEKVRDMCMRKIEVTEHDRVAQHEVYQQKKIAQTEAKVLALQKYNPKLLDRWTKVGAVCSDFVELFNGDFFRPGKWYKVSRKIRNLAQGHGVKIDRHIMQSDTFESRLQVGILTLLEEVNTFYNKNKQNPTIQLVVPYIEKFLVHALSHANEQNLDSSFGLFNCGFVTFKVLTESQSDGLSYGVGSLLPDQVKRDIRSLYCLYPCALFEKLVGALGDFNDSYQACAESLGVIGPNTPQKATLVRDINEHVKKNGLWNPSMTSEERVTFDIREVMRNDLKLMGVYETAQEEAMRKHQHTTTDPPGKMYEDCKKHIIEPVNEASSQEREPTAVELIAERNTQKELQQKQQMLQQPVTSIVHPKSADCTQKTDSSQTSQSNTNTQEIQKTDNQTDSQSAQAVHELQQAVYAQAASDYQKGLDLYGDKLTDAQRTRYENRRDAFLEAYNNPDQITEYNYTLPVESQRMLQAAGINISQFMSGSGNALERLVHHEQHQIAGKLQEYALQMPEGKKRNGVLREMLSNMRHASALQQCGIHQLSLIPIDQNWMLIDSIDQFGFGIIDPPFMQKVEENRHIDWSAAARTVCDVTGRFAYNVGYGFCVKGPVNAANLIYLTVSNIPATIEASAKLVKDKNAAIDLLCASAVREVGSATLTLLACGIPESALKDQMAHWSEQQHVEAAACVEQAAERIRTVANNPIPTTIHAIGNHLVHDAASAGVTTYNILYGLSCMEAACETFDKDLELQLFAQGEKLLQENLPTAKQTAEFAGEMLFWHYVPGLAAKHTRRAYGKLSERFARRAGQSAAQAGKILEPTIELMPYNPMGSFLTDAEINAMVRDLASASVTEEVLLGEATLIERRVTSETIASTKKPALSGIVATEEAPSACAAAATGDSASVNQSNKVQKGKVASRSQKAVSHAERSMLEAAERKLAKKMKGVGERGTVQKVKSGTNRIFVMKEGLTEEAAAKQATKLEKALAKNSNLIIVEEKEFKKMSQEFVKKAKERAVQGLEPEVNLIFEKTDFDRMFGADEYNTSGFIHQEIVDQQVDQIYRPFFDEMKQTCEVSSKERVKALQALKDEIGITVQDCPDWIHIRFGNAGGKLSGFHDATYCSKTVLKVLEIKKHSMEVMVGRIRDNGILVLDIKTIFMPGTTRYEMDCLFNQACMKLYESQKYPESGTWRCISELIDGQRYQWFIDKDGIITSFFPTNYVGKK